MGSARDLSLLREHAPSAIPQHRPGLAEEPPGGEAQEDDALRLHGGHHRLDMAPAERPHGTFTGTESGRQLDLVRAEGCHEVRGYLFGRPRPLNELLPDIRPGMSPEAPPEAGAQVA